MKTIIISFILLLNITFKTISQNEVNVVFTETTLNNAMKVIKDARGLNFGEYLNQNGLNAWYLNLDNAQFDIKSNNIVNINNLKLTGGVDLQLWAFGKTATGDITGSIGGEIGVSGNNEDGYFLHVVPTITSFVYSGTLQSVINLIAFLTNNFSDYIPKVELNLGNSLLPDLMLKYFECGVPDISSNENELKLIFRVLFEDIEIKNKKIESGENVSYTASNSITFSENFTVEQGATFSAYITPKCNSYLKSANVYQEPNNIKIGDTITAAKEINSIQQIYKSDSVKIIEEFSSVDVFPNPFVNTVAVKSSSKNEFSVSITDLQGKIVYENNNLKGIEELNLSHLKSGAYILKFMINHSIESKKIIKE